MDSNALPSLKLPSFLFGTYTAVRRKATREGHRCAEHYRMHGVVPAVQEVLGVTPGEVLVMAGAVDFQREHPAWRIYMFAEVMDRLCESLDWQNAFHISDVYEESCRETPWGALGLAVSHPAPMSAERVALRIKSVLRFWDSLQPMRYLFNSTDILLSLEELMVAACDWTMEAWCPEGGSSVRLRLEMAAERLKRATKEDSIEAILRQLPRTLPFARGLKHPDTLTNPALWRERLATLDAESFERVSAAQPANLLERMYLWDKQLESQ